MGETPRTVLTEILELADYRRTIRWMRENNFVMDEPFDTPRGKFELVLYTALAEITELAAGALGVEFPRCECGTVNDCAKHGWRYDQVRGAQ